MSYSEVNDARAACLLWVNIQDNQPELTLTNQEMPCTIEPILFGPPGRSSPVTGTEPVDCHEFGASTRTPTLSPGQTKIFVHLHSWVHQQAPRARQGYHLVSVLEEAVTDTKVRINICLADLAHYMGINTSTLIQANVRVHPRYDPCGLQHSWNPHFPKHWLG